MDSTRTKPDARRPRIVCLVLVALTLALYWPAGSYDFVFFDDPDYVTENEKVQAGLTWAGFKWAFTSFEASNWHPLTWLSHMLDCQLFGVQPGPHHLINVLFHASNAVLLFLFLFRSKRGLWASAFIAGLFAWHPLRVESVAWIAERKDVLSMFFGLLALLAYQRYAAARKSEGAAGNEIQRRISWLNRHWLLTFCFFALALLSKPMFVTLPFVLLLLDYWPLERISHLGFQALSPGQNGKETLAALIFEKLPFFALTTISCALTFLAQRAEAVAHFADVALSLRLGNVVIAYASYLEQMLLPIHLAVLYPLPKELPAGRLMLAGVVLAGISALVWRKRRESPFLPVGWLWYLGTLVPVIGLVQVGNQAMADRYTYLPLIGISIAATFAFRQLAARWRWNPAALAAFAGVLLFGCLIGTRLQLRHWQNSETLFRHALAVTKNNDIIHSHLGAYLVRQNRPAEAITELQRALAIDPNYSQTHFRMGHALFYAGDLNGAISHFRKATELQPDFAEAHNNLGGSLLETGRLDAAILHLQKALQFQPKNEKAHYNLGRACRLKGLFDEAATHFQNALALDADFTAARIQLANVLLNQGRGEPAVQQLSEAARRRPDDPFALLQLARVLAAHNDTRLRNGAEAVRLAEKANALTDGEEPFALDILAMACAETGRMAEARQAARRAMELAREAGWTEFASEVQSRLQLYQSGRPYREDFIRRSLTP